MRFTDRHVRLLAVSVAAFAIVLIALDDQGDGVELLLSFTLAIASALLAIVWFKARETKPS